MAATCGVGLNTAIATGVSLLGDVHGGAGQQCLALLRRLADADDLDAGAWPTSLADHRARALHVPGFGHRFHPLDPRRDPLVGAVESAVAAGTVEGRHLAAALELERSSPRGAAGRCR